MKFKIVHDTPGRIRLRCGGHYFDKNQEKSLEKTILSEQYVESVKAKSVNGGILITYQSDYRQELLNYIKGIKRNQLAAVEDESEDIQADFKNEIIKMLIKRFVLRRILPYPVRVAMAYFKAFPYVKKAVGSVLNLRADVALLDGVALGTALSRGMYSEVNSITFLLGVSVLLEEYTRKRTKNALADSLAMKIDTVWKKNGENEEQVPISTVKEGDFVVFRDGAMITFDGVVVSGQASVNEASMTGESVAAVKDKDSTVYAGTVVEAGNIVIKVSAAADNTRISNIIEMIENGESMKAGVQSRAEKIADGFVPYSLGLALLVYLTTRNVVKAMSVLMVDYSCAIKLSTPISIISAMREASSRGFVVKGGRYLESVSHADTIVFDKTGTLTTGELSVNKVFAYGNHTSSEIIALAAACERYSSHPIAMAIKNKAEKENLPELSDYSEKAGQGVTAVYNGKALVCGGTKVLSDKQKVNAEKTASVYVIYDGELIGAISVSDTLRPEAKSVIAELRKLGVKDSVMLTGDKKENAMDIANELKLDSYSAELMPSDKLEKLIDIKKTHKSVCFIGDGINDAPVLTASDCGFAMGFGSEAAIEAADAVLAAGNLKQLPLSVRIAKKVVATVKTNITFALGVKTIVIILAILGIAPMWLSVIADTGVSVLCVLYAARLLHAFDKK